MSKRDSYKKNFYLAKKSILPQLEPIVDILLNLHKEVETIANKHNISFSDLLDWVDNQLPSGQNETEEEDNDDEQ